MIQVKNLHFTYQKTQKEAIKNMCFDVAKGEVFGFLGPSGAGKTTTQTTYSLGLPCVSLKIKSFIRIRHYDTNYTFQKRHKTDSS